MGTKTIWDGEDLPPIGCEVLIHLASLDKWVPHKVSGYDVKKDRTGQTNLYRVMVLVEPSSDPRSAKNGRCLSDVRPLDWAPEGPTISGDPFTAAGR